MSEPAPHGRRGSEPAAAQAAREQPREADLVGPAPAFLPEGETCGLPRCTRTPLVGWYADPAIRGWRGGCAAHATSIPHPDIAPSPAEPAPAPLVTPTSVIAKEIPAMTDPVATMPAVASPVREPRARKADVTYAPRAWKEAGALATTLTGYNHVTSPIGGRMDLDVFKELDALLAAGITGTGTALLDAAGAALVLVTELQRRENWKRTRAALLPTVAAPTAGA